MARASWVDDSWRAIAAASVGLIFILLFVWLAWPTPVAAQAQTEQVQAEQVQAEQVQAEQVQAEKVQADSAQTSMGESLFSVNCAACHANGGNIIRRGKNLKQKTLARNGYGNVAAIASLVTQGKGIMPAYADRLSTEEIEAIAQYVYQKSNAGW
ncbi:MAG: cytochrome c6 PetJ [Phormidesmis priestleyi Ana]|uniref:Cytochrome c6 PetJ n=1 Tax=Phormidesmis priestleyi Ana TaxID=1666911 RepID=A0A0P7YZV9_9CYAN|nr:MAG: cytochrome c6 PetJ [Phormidesmis priestleyi Ana]